MDHEVRIYFVVLLILFVLDAQRVRYYVVDVGVQRRLVEPKQKYADHHAEESVQVVTFELRQVWCADAIAVPNRGYYQPHPVNYQQHLFLHKVRK